MTKGALGLVLLQNSMQHFLWLILICVPFPEVNYTVIMTGVGECYEPFKGTIFFIIYHCAGWGYIVAFTKVFIIYHT
jgi:hypothetical protein